MCQSMKKHPLKTYLDCNTLCQNFTKFCQDVIQRDEDCCHRSQQNITCLARTHICMHAHTHTHTFVLRPLDFVRDYPGESVTEPIWILLKQETVSGSGISCAICKFAPSPRLITMPAPHHSVFTGRLTFLNPSNSVKALKANRPWHLPLGCGSVLNTELAPTIH